MKRQLFLTLSVLMMVFGVQAQEDSLLIQYQANFDRFARENPQERVYLHFDNTSYYKGEHIWYKAYVVEGASLRPSNLSRILYVELVNPIGIPVETQKLALRDGQVSGSFLLNDTLNAGFYEVRAYTAWMLNFTPGNGHGWKRLNSRSSREFYGNRFMRYLEGNAGIFSRVFPVYERVSNGDYTTKRIPLLPKATASLVEKERDKIQIDFYPEGGNMVRGVPTRVAFQAHTSEGRTLNVEGKLMRGNRQIGTFKTDYAGRGLFQATADSTDEREDEVLRGLKLCVNYEGHDYTFRLPKSHRRGYVLNVFNSEKTLTATVARNNQTKGEPMGLSITCRGNTLYYDVLDLRRLERANMVIDKTSLMTGVNIFTLYNIRGEVVAQREVFVNNHDMDGYRLQVTLPEDTTVVCPYGKIEAECQIVDRNGQPVEERTRLSVAVTDGQYRDANYADYNVLSYLLLSSEVKGFIPHPEYYFEKDDQEHAAALDMLLMIQGWTRYDFERMMSTQEWKPLLGIEQGLNFRGQIADDNGYYERAQWSPLRKPIHVFTELQSPQYGVLTQDIETDSAGRFHINYAPFYGKVRMYFTLNKDSAEVIGEKQAGVAGHLFDPLTYKRPAFLVGKRLIPLNPYSPLPRNFDYYETMALDEPIDKNIFRTGFMTTIDDDETPFMYDRYSKTFRIKEVTKTKRRNWSDFREVKPVAVLDVSELMTYLSNIFGDVQDFHYFGFHSGDIDHFGSDTRLSMGGGSWGGINFNDGGFTINGQIGAVTDGHEPRRYTPYDSDNYNHIFAGMGNDNPTSSTGRSFRLDFQANPFRNYDRLLMLLGIDGMKHEFVNPAEVGGEPIYRHPDIYGKKENLPTGMKFFPADINFRRLRLYADVSDRRLIHQRGRYNEVLYAYDPQSTTNDDHPLTSILAFETDSIWDDGVPEPEFYGFRINFQGFSEPDEFYRVDYSQQPLPEQGDYRRTVYWNPNLRTDEHGHARFSFYNNGFSRQLTVSAEGMSKGGKAIIQE